MEIQVSCGVQEKTDNRTVDTTTREIYHRPSTLEQQVTDMGIFDTAKRLATGRRYTVDDVMHGIEHPRAIVSEINQQYNHWRAGQPYNPDGIDVFAEDWDNLLILDACRYDEFVRRSNLPGKTEHRISRGSTSPEFVRGNFGGKRLHDVVYVSANNWYAKIRDAIGAEIHALYSVDRDTMEGLTSRPETVAATARDAAAEYPDKRLIVHFMQPHQPYLGPAGERFEFSVGLMDTIQRTNATHADVMQAYRENLDIVLGEVEPLLGDLQGKTVVSADHGELLGDRERPIPIRTYRHPEGIYVDGLVKVPWHIYQNGERKEIVAEQPAQDENDIDIEAVEQHLADLGYRV